MKKGIILFLATLGLGAFMQCSTTKDAYNVPPELSPEDKIELVQIATRGKKLYGIHCSSCHGKNYKSMDHGDQFTEAQIKAYEVFMRIRNETHEFTQRMNSQDLDAIIIYLKYRKV